MANEKHCGTCKHWKDTPGLSIMGLCACTRFPPALFFIEGRFKSRFPLMAAEAVCGEWGRKTKTAVKEKAASGYQSAGEVETGRPPH